MVWGSPRPPESQHYCQNNGKMLIVFFTKIFHKCMVDFSRGYVTCGITREWIQKQVWESSRLPGRQTLRDLWQCKSVTLLTQKNIFIFLDFYGEPFHAWEIWLSPHLEKPVGSEVGGLDACPWIGSPVGNQACIVPRLLWDLLLLKLPHPELRQQMFTEYL